MPNDQPDQRDSPRVTVNREFAGLESFVAEYVTDISRSGIFIRSSAPLPVGTRVNLRFSIVLDEIEIVEGVGEIVRCHNSGDGPTGMGVVFVELTPDSERLIEKMMADFAAAGGSLPETP